MSEHSGFNSFGKKVSESRISQGLNFLKENFTLTEVELDHYLHLAVKYIQSDRIDRFFEEFKNSGIDITGQYRLLSELCTDHLVK